MAEAVLEVLLENLNSFVQNELASFWGVNQETKKLSSTFTAIRAVLEDAEEQQMANHAIKDWLQKLKDAAYVVDDILDECSIETAPLSREGENSGSSSEVHGTSLSCLNLKNTWFRYKVGKRMKEIGERLKEIAEERQNFHLQERVIERQVEIPEWRQTSSIIGQPQIYGRDEDREQIVEFLLSQARESDQISIYSVVGFGGLGKTTLAQLVFNDGRLKRQFDTKIWVCVSENFSIKRILQSIIECITGKINDSSNLELMQSRVQELLQAKRYLLILDDVWNENHDKWDKLKSVLACGSKGASILVTTRLINVASITGTHDPHYLSGLSEDDNWSLFKQRAFGPNREQRAELIAIGKEIVRKCGGSPLAAKALGSLLRFKNEEKEWAHVKDSKLWELPQDESSILPALKLSYYNLTAALRRCFAFCAIFPKGSEISKEDLIHLWMANGLISSRGNYDLEDVGNEVWNELYQRSFFQDVKIDEFGCVKSFKMHDLVLDLAQFVSGEECQLVENADFTSLSRSIHHVSYLDDWFGNDCYFRGYGPLLRLHKVESLRTHFQLFSFVAVSNGSQAFRSLRALKTYGFLPSSLNNLIHLRYLCLNCALLKTLPESICCLRKLQTLKLEVCWEIRHLPKQLTCLRDLRHLIMDGIFRLHKMPPKIGKLTCLRRLSHFVVGSETGYRLSELHDLKLGGDLAIVGLENVPTGSDAQEANLTSKKDLVTLHLAWSLSNNGETDAEQVLGALQPPPNLRSLKISGYKGLHLPSWMVSCSVLKSLVSLELWFCIYCQQLPPLGRLPSLERLKIEGMKNVRHIDDNSYDCVAEKAFPSLKKLTLRFLPNLERLLKDEGSVQMFPSLSELIIYHVPKLMLPAGLPSVELLEVTICIEELLKSISNYQGLKFLCLDGNEDLESLPEGMVQNLYHLKTLTIKNFRKLKVLPTQLTGLSSLEKLDVIGCAELESFPEALGSLRTLSIENCWKLRSLSEGVGHLTSLENLTIRSCPMLVARPNNMNQLIGLRKLQIGGSLSNNTLPEGLERIPFLQSLEIFSSGLASLPDCLGDLVSLQQIKISCCPELSTLPSSFLRLTNLQQLYIDYCPKLEKQCKKGSGEDWHKIMHIQQIHLGSSKNKLGFCDTIGMKWRFRKPLMREFIVQFSE